MTKKLAFPKEKMRILLVEGIDPIAAERFKDAGYKVEARRAALSEKELLAELPSVHVLGIRSKTTLTPKVIDAASHLLAVGCFCIGTNQVALARAASRGIAVFNAPFSNTRSVAELTMAEIVMLARRATHKSRLLHDGVWEKSADGCVEVRNKTIGIVGYGHIGPQVGLLAESFGMRVLFYDITTKLPLGNAQQVPSLDQLLSKADFVTLHVPETELTRNMIAAKELAKMRKGALLLNLSRGTVVDVPALAKALKSGHLAGAAVDVFPVEPSSNNETFVSELRGLDNVILTPHVGGSTLEAQYNIGIEVATSLIKYTDAGASAGAVNFPEVDLPLVKDCHRLLNIHRNVPGVLSEINSIIAHKGGNISSQVLRTKDDIGYLVMDIDQKVSRAVKSEIDSLDANIRTRLLF